MRKKTAETLAEVCRFLLGAVFIIAGLSKAVDFHGFVGQIERFDLIARHTHLIAGALLFLELFLGLLCVLGLYPRMAVGGLGLLLSLFSIVIAYGLATGKNASCGCFSDMFGHVGPEAGSLWLALIRDILLLVPASFAWYFSGIEEST